jgi:hypothetical protein
MDVDDFEKTLRSISDKLDKIELELEMNAEAIEAIELNVMFLKAEIEFEEERSRNDYWT